MTTKITRSEMLAEEMTRFCLDRMLLEEGYRLLEIDFITPMLHLGGHERIIRVKGHILTSKGEGTFNGEMMITRAEDSPNWLPAMLHLVFDTPTSYVNLRFECGYDDPKSANRKLIIKEPVVKVF